MKNSLKSRSFTLLIGLLYFVANYAQDSYYEIGGGITVAHYSGDLSPEFGKVILNANPGIYGLIRFVPDSRINFKATLTYASLDESDARSSRDWQKQRNLSFNSNIFETALTAEVNLIPYHSLNSTLPFTIYLMGGVSGFYFNPRAEYEGQWYSLQKLGTEGQGLEAYPEKSFYSLFQIAFPLGGGIKYMVSENLNLNLELGLRYTLTDYIDDISGRYADYNILLEQRGQAAADLAHGLVEKGSNLTYEINPPNSGRGGPTVNDYFSFIQIGLTYNMFDIGSRGPQRKRFRSGGKVKCPSF